MSEEKKEPLAGAAENKAENQGETKPLAERLNIPDAEPKGPVAGAVEKKEPAKPETPEKDKKPLAERVAGEAAQEEKIEGETEADRKDLPDFGGNDKAKQAFIRERIRHRRELEEVRAGKAEPPADGAQSAGDTGGRPDAASARQAQGKAEPNAENTELVFKLRAKAMRALAGERIEGMAADQARKIIEISEQAKETLSDPDWVLGVIAKAKKGEYGEDSEAILEDAMAELPLVLGRERVSARVATEKEGKAAEWNRAIEGKIAETLERHPALKDEKSEEAKFVQEWLKANVTGEPGKPGRRYNELGDPANVPGLIEDALAAYRSQEAEKLRKENESLRRRLGGLESPRGGGDAGRGTGEEGNKKGKTLAERLKI